MTTPDQSKKAQDVTHIQWKSYPGCSHDSDQYICGSCADRQVAEIWQAAQAAGRESFIAGELDETHWACGHSKWAAKGDCITCLSHCIDSLNKRLSETTIQLTTLQSQEAAPPPADETQPASSNSPKYMQQGSITTQSLELPAQPSGAQGEGVLTEFEHSEIIRLASYPNNGVTIAEYVETLLAAAREPEAGGK